MPENNIKAKTWVAYQNCMNNISKIETPVACVGIRKYLFMSYVVALLSTHSGGLWNV
jgi:hypothetical protein